MYQHEFWQWERVVPKQVCETIISRVFDPQKVEKGCVRTGRGGYENLDNVRVTDVVWSRDPELSELAFRFMHSANAEANWHITATVLEELQISRYGIGGHYDWHIDCSAPQNGLQRKLSFSLQLSSPDEYAGGDLVFGRNCPQVATRTQGSIIVFPSCIFHKVTPVTEGQRFSVVGWIRGPQFR